MNSLLERSLILVAGLMLAQEPAPGQAPPATEAATEMQTFDFVFVISVDGLRSDAIPAGGPRRLPTLHRLLSGSSTLNARTDPEYTLTLPNHTSMITGRPTAGPHGHGWKDNADPPEGETLHTRAGFEIVSIFDIAHLHGVSTGLFFSKSKFSLWISSFNTGREPADMAISRAAFAESMSEVTDHAIETLGLWERGLVFLHYARTDLVGHQHGWDLTPGSPYMLAVGEIDAEIGRLIAAIESRDGLKGRCAIIVTTDHGGGYPLTSHVAPHMWVNYIIPFLVWTGDEAPSADLYELNASVRRDPSLTRPPCAEPGDPEADRTQPIRNGDAANLALQLLGLPPVPGSIINANRTLRVSLPQRVEESSSKDR